MRVSTGYQFETFSSQVALTQSRMFEAQQAVSTGKRFLHPSDNPVGTRIVLSYKQLKAANEQYAENLNMAKGFLGFTEQALSESSQIAAKGYELAVRGANTSTSQDGRNAMVNEVIELQKRLVNLANTQGPSGQYIFAGQQTDQKSYNVVAGTLVYTGDANSLNVEIGPVETLPMNSVMSQTFIDAYSHLEDLKTNLQGGNIGTLSGVSIPDLQSSMSAINQERGHVGSKLQSVEEMTSNLARRAQDLTSSVSDVEDVDLTEAILKYKQAETAYHAALQVASQGYGLSLMDFIRG